MYRACPVRRGCVLYREYVLYEVGVSCMKTVYSVQKGCVLYGVSRMQRVCTL